MSVVSRDENKSFLGPLSSRLMCPFILSSMFSRGALMYQNPADTLREELSKKGVTFYRLYALLSTRKSRSAEEARTVSVINVFNHDSGSAGTPGKPP